MKYPERIESWALAAGAGAALGIVAVIALPYAPLGGRDAREIAMIAETRTRLERAAAVRYEDEGEGHDDRFDALVGSLVAGVGTDTPSALGPVLERIVAARALERTPAPDRAVRGQTARSGSRIPVAVNPEVDRALADARRSLEREAALEGESVIAATGAGSWLVRIAALLAVAAVGLSARARAFRRAERARVAAVMGCPASLAHDGSLAPAVSRHLDAEREEATRRANARSGEHARPLFSPPPQLSLAPPARSAPNAAPSAGPSHPFDPHFDPASAARVRAEEADEDTADFELGDETPVPGLDDIRILEIKAEPLEAPATASD